MGYLVVIISIVMLQAAQTGLQIRTAEREV